MFPVNVRDKLKSQNFSQAELGQYLLAVDGEIDRLHKVQIEQLDLLSKLQKSVSDLEYKLASKR